jgi:polyisoprenoid-binding protein YceI
MLACTSLTWAQSGTPVAETSDTRVQAAGETVFQLDPDSSTVRIYVFRGGKAPKLGHNHVLSAPTFTGAFQLSDKGTAGSRFSLSFRLDQLVFDKAEHRAALGANFASIMSEDAIEGTRRNMLGDKIFQADQYPLVHIRSVQISGDAPKFAARVEIEMHGQSREQWVALSVIGLPEALQASGALVLRPSDFGVQPFSILGGLLAVQDEVVVEFNLQGRKALQPNAP